MAQARVAKQVEKVVTNLQATAGSVTQTEPLKDIVSRLLGQINGVERRLPNRARAFSLLIFSFLPQASSMSSEQELKLLHQLTKLIKTELRQTDIVGLFGKERLVIGLLGASQIDAVRIAQQLKARVEEELQRLKAEMWVSYGLTSLQPGMTAEQLLSQAQATLTTAGMTELGRLEQFVFQNPLFSRLILVSYRAYYQRLAIGLERISFVFISTAQFIAGTLTLLWLRVSTRLEITGLENLQDVKEPMLVVANHESHLDPMLLGMVFVHRPGLLPLRYMAKNELFNYPVFNLIIFLLGAFRAHKKRGLEKSLLTPLRTLKSKGAVIIFPEGHIVKDRPMLGGGRRGAAILAAISGAGIVPLSIHTPANLTPWKMLTQRPRIAIRVGQQFYLKDPEYLDFSDDQMTAATNLIMSKIAELYHQHHYN